MLERHQKGQAHQQQGELSLIHISNDKGIRHAEAITQGQVDPLIFFHTFEEYLDFYLGTHHPETLTDVEWLSLPEHHLLALTKAEFYVDMLHCQERLEPLRFYPENVWLYLVASC